MKQAYPNYDDYIAHKPSRNTEKWMETFRAIRARCNYGVPFQQAFNTSTHDWPEDERLDFSYWIKFYEEQNHMKYKRAQYGYNGYYLPTRQIPEPIPAPGAPGSGATPAPGTADLHSAKDQNAMSEEELKRKIELHRKKIIARLHSARKLLTDDNGKAVAGERWEKLLDALNDLEKQFHQVNKKTESSEIFQDMIFRRANMFKRDGFVKSHDFLVTFAQGLPMGAGDPREPYLSETHGGGLGNISPNLFADDGDEGEDGDEEDEDVKPNFKDPYTWDTETIINTPCVICPNCGAAKILIDDAKNEHGRYAAAFIHVRQCKQKDSNDDDDVGSPPPSPPGAPGAPPPAPGGMPGLGGGDSEKGMKEFLNGLNGLGPDDDDQSEAEDEGNVEIDDAEADVLDIEDYLNIEDSYLGINNHGYRATYAQLAPGLPKPVLNPDLANPGMAKPEVVPNKPAPKLESKPLVQRPVGKAPDIEVSDHDVKPGVVQGKDFDALIDAAFATLKVADIVKQLDDLSRIFKNREIARRLSIVDMMMDKLGLSSFFPSLAEATRSALESNQYCLTRVEEVRSKLGGALDVKGGSLHDMGQQHSINNQPDEVDLKVDEEPSGGELSGVKQRLGDQMEKDKLRKEMRKNVEQANLLNQVENRKAPDKKNPEVEPIAEELGPITKKVEKPAIPPTVTPGGPMAPAAK